MKCYELYTKKSPLNKYNNTTWLRSKILLSIKYKDMKKVKEILTRFQYNIRVKYFLITNHGSIDKQLLILYFKSILICIRNILPIITETMKRFKNILIAVKNIKILNRADVMNL